jgi:uncharacterized protein YdcH (DUF465 family)
MNFTKSDEYRKKIHKEAEKQTHINSLVIDYNSLNF